MSPELIAALGAFLSGLASVLTAVLSVRQERKRGEEVCEQRLQAFREGMDVE